MSKWLTTGQMIDKLKVGQWAGSDKYNLTVTKDLDGKIKFGDPLDGHLLLNFHVTDTMWRMLPEYVPFEEALKAYKNGMVITCVYGNEEPSKDSFSLKKPECESDLSMRMAAYGKWIIEEGPE